MSKAVIQLYPTSEQLRSSVEDAVAEALACAMMSSGLGRYRADHLRGAMEGVVDVLTTVCVAWTTQGDEAAANDLARDIADLLISQVAESAYAASRDGANG